MKYFKKYGKKIPLNVIISGKIGTNIIYEGMIVQGDRDDILYFRQDIANGSGPTNTTKYKYSWEFNIYSDGTLSDTVVIDKWCLKKEEYEIF